MKTVIKFFAQRQRATILLLIIGVLFGYYSYLTVPKEDSPDIEIPFIYVVMEYTGISPEDAKKLLVKPMEQAFRNIEHIKELESFAYEGSGVIIAHFDPGADSDKALRDVREKVNDTIPQLPADTKQPTIRQINLSLLPVLDVILQGDIPLERLVVIARDLKNKIEGITDILAVEIGGDRKDVVEILVKPATLSAYNLNLTQLTDIIKKENKLVALGQIINKNGAFSLKLQNTISSAQDLLSFPIIEKDGIIVKLGDIAEVRKTYKNPLQITRVNGKNTVVLEVSKRTGANIIDTVNKVKSVLTAEKEYLPDNLNIIYSQDQSQSIIDIISDLENGLLLAIILVTITVVISVGGRSAALIALSIPTSFLVGILIMHASGYTLNIVVLFSLILTVGMIVDDAIVVSEYADRKIIEGMPVVNAYIHSAHRMLWPIVTSTLVKIFVFMPLLFWPGITGQFMRFMPITVIIILTNSLLFALFFQPALGKLFGRSSKINQRAAKAMHASEEGNINDLQGFSKKYYHLLQKILRWPKSFVGGCLVLVIGVYFFFYMIGTGVQFFPKIEPKSAVIVLKSKGNLSITQKDRFLKQAEQQILDLEQDIKVFYAKAGDFKKSNSMPQDAIASIRLEFQDWRQRRKAKEIEQEIRQRLKAIKGISIEVLHRGEGPTSHKPIDINFFSRNSQKLHKFIGQVRQAMQNMGGFTDIEDTLSLPGIDWHIEVDRQLAGLYGLNSSEVGKYLQLFTGGYKISSFHPDYADEEVDIMLRYFPDYRTTHEIDRLNVMNKDNVAIPLGNFAKKVAKHKVSHIKRINRNDVITVKAAVAEHELVADKIEQLRAWLQEHADPEIKYEFKGEAEDQQEAAEFLSKAFLVAFLLMFMVMLIQFNSFYHTIVVMSAVFLATTGVLLGLIVTWQPFGIVMCGIGVIALSGIVLNNNILFIDTYQFLRKHGHEVEDAIMRAGIQRLRPILLTAITAILGLLPMVFGLTINFFNMEVFYDSPTSQWWRQLSASIAGGLAFATLLTLFFTPCLLLIGQKFDRRYKESD
jgi:multidrug efflux pump